MNKRIGTASLVSLVLLFSACSPSGNTDPKRATSASTSVAAPAVAATEGFVYTANERGNSISAIDIGTGQVRTIATSFTPHNVQISRDGRWLLAVGSAAEMTANKTAMDMSAGGKADDGKTAPGRLMIFDAATLGVETAANIEIGRSPAHVIVDAQGQRAYATNSDDDNVMVIDIQQKKVVAVVKVGGAPHGLRMSPNGKEIYAANVNDNSVSVIDVAKSAEIMRIAVGKAPVQVAFTPDGGRAYVSLRDENAVAVIDTVQRKMIASVELVGRNPIQVFVTPDGRHAYIANQGTETNPDNRVSVIDIRTNHLIDTILTGKGAHGVVISGDGKRVFISNITESTVSVIDTSTRQVIATIKVGEGPNGITFRTSDRPAIPEQGRSVDSVP